MTIREAAALWNDPRRVHLEKWEKDFNQPLAGLHIGHVHTYRTQRAREVDISIVNMEVEALRAMLKQAGTGEEIDRYYRPIEEAITLTPEELNGLSHRVRTYIFDLEKALDQLQSEHYTTKNRLRKANWANWSRKR